MLEWSIPEAEDEDWINSCIAVSGTMASDASFANIYLLRNKYSTKISRYKVFWKRCKMWLYISAWKR